jgi:dipeptidyl aminopeptidase/acylaminoacyl peptidase
VFSNLSEGGDRFTWDFGDGTTQTTFDPIQTILHEFTEAGVHTVTLTAGEPGSPGNPGNEEGTARLEITVEPGAPSRIDFGEGSGSIVIEAGGTTTIQARARDRFDNEMSDAPVTLEVQPGSGSVSADGTYTAPTMVGTYRAALTGRFESAGSVASGLLTVVVVPGPLTGFVLDPGETEFAAGQAVRFSVTGVDRFGNEIPAAQAVVEAGPAGNGVVELDLRGRVHMPTVPGRYPDAITATATLADTTVSGNIDISIVPGPFAAVEVMPSNLQLDAGETVVVQAQATDEYGNVLSGVSLTYSADPLAGAIGQDGLFAAVTSTGAFEEGIEVVGDLDGSVRRAVVPVHLSAGPLNDVVVELTSAVAGNPAHTLAATAIDQFGNPIPGDSGEAATVEFSFALPEGAGELAGSSLAVSTVAAFYAEGLVVIATQQDREQGTVTRAVRVDFEVVAGPVESVAIFPDRPTIQAGGLSIFVLTGLDEYGNHITGLEAKFSMDDQAAGTIEPKGLFTASNTAGTYERAVKVIVRHGKDTFAARTTVVIKPGPLAVAGLAPGTAATSVLRTVEFSVIAQDAFGNELTATLVEYTADAAVGAIDPDGRLTVGQRAGTFDNAVTATVTVGNVSFAATANVVVEPSFFSAVTIQPGTVILGRGQTRTFTAQPQDAFGNAVSGGATVRWSMGDRAAGVVNSNGVLTPGTPGSYPLGLTAEVTLGGTTVSATADLTILSNPVEDLVISGADAIQVGQTSQLTITDLAGLALPDDFAVAFSVVDEATGSVTADGLLTGGHVAGTYASGVLVTATRGEEALTGIVAVTLTPGPLDSVVVSPDAIELGKGQEQQFVAIAVDEFGNRTPIDNLKWSVDRGGGTVLSNGVFIAGNGRGDFRGTVSATASQFDGDDTLAAIARADVVVVGDRLTFRSQRVDGVDVYVLDTERTTVQRVTTDDGKTPRWSPDGKRILYGLGGQLFIISDDGRWRSQVFSSDISGDQQGFEADWSPDGRHVVFEDGEEIYTVEIDGTSVVRLTSNIHMDDLPMWSPNGSFIAFVSNRQGADDIWRMEPNGDLPTLLTTNFAAGEEGIDTRPAWSPGGELLAYVSGQGGLGPAIHYMSPNGSSVTRVTLTETGLGEVGCPEWAGGTERFALQIGSPSPSLFLVDRDGTNLAALTTSEFPDLCPDWSPAKTGSEMAAGNDLVFIPEAGDLPGLPKDDIVHAATSSVAVIEVTGRAQTTFATAFLIDGSGRALTTNSAVTGATSLTVFTPDGQELEAFVIGRDLVRDLAVISVLGWKGTPLSLGTVSHLSEASGLYVVGNIIGQSGVAVETVHRVAMDADPSRNIVWLVTDGDWNGNFEGAPVIDPRGNVVGLVSHSIEDLENGLTGLAISSNTIDIYLDRLKLGRILSN